jgi:hypothetical protein
VPDLVPGCAASGIPDHILPDHILHFGDHLAGSERLCEEAAVVDENLIPNGRTRHERAPAGSARQG